MNDNKKKYEPEIDFKAVLKNPKRLFGWVFPYFFFIILILGIFYVHNLNTISTNTTPVLVTDDGNAKRELTVKKGSDTEPVDLSMIQNPSQDLINRGEELYSTNCASCHGDLGLGDGPAGAALNPPPRDFTTTEGWVNGRRFIDMYKTLEEGIIENGMAAYEYMPPVDRIGIIHFTRTFADFPEITDDEVQELESTYGLTEGSQTAGQIPVETAIDRLLREKFQENKVYQLIDYVNNHPNEEGNDIFNKVVSNRKRVLSTFYSSNINQYEFDQFVTIIQNNGLELGFKANVNTLSRAEMTTLFDYLKRVVSYVQG